MRIHRWTLTGDGCGLRHHLGRDELLSKWCLEPGSQNGEMDNGIAPSYHMQSESPMDWLQVKLKNYNVIRRPCRKLFGDRGTGKDFSSKVKASNRHIQDFISPFSCWAPGQQLTPPQSHQLLKADTWDSNAYCFKNQTELQFIIS